LNKEASEALQTRKHIKEIEGLRAVAVISVILFHLELPQVPGGFVGVDVFFVISGYLITGILFAGLERGDLSLSTFYARRVLRIAPALFVTLAVSACLFFLLLPSQFSSELKASLFAALLSYSNIWFFWTIDYFTDKSTNPLLHIWSLAVEEQFYLAFPLLLLVIRRFRLTRFKLQIVAALALVSFVTSCIVVRSNQPEAFYFPWLRAWELLAGGLLAGLRLDRIPTPVKSILSDVGLILVIVSCVTYSETMVFPGYSALAPVLGSAAIISGVNGRSVSNYLLSAVPMRFIGKISYSLYLVHWPVICLSTFLINSKGIKSDTAILIATVIPAWASWKFIETPFRRLAAFTPSRRVLTGFAGATAFMLTAIPSVQVVGSRLWDGGDLDIYLNTITMDRGFFRMGSCLLEEKEDLASFMAAGCLVQSDQKPNILLLGDSHAANLWSTLATQHTEFNFIQATAINCKPTLSTSGARECVKLQRYMFDKWLPGDGAQVKYIMLAARWDTDDIQPLKATITYLKSLGKKVFLYGPSPEFFISPPLMMAYGHLLNRDLQTWFFRSERRDLDRVFKAEFSDSTTYFSPLDMFCPNKCILLARGVPTMLDRDHLTPEGAALMTAKIPIEQFVTLDQP
jgi:peptidoglycan/LPS O-acetylase OafA/YrhL